MWARQLGKKNGVIVPNQAAEHYYLLTEPIEGVEKSWPGVWGAGKGFPFQQARIGLVAQRQGSKSCSKQFGLLLVSVENGSCSKDSYRKLELWFACPSKTPQTPRNSK
eukprot:4868770-Amphidinium_carterae.1